MSRQIDIFYRPKGGDQDVAIEVRAPYFLFGTQQLSLAFWKQPRLREIGIKHLVELGHSDPIYFIGWEMLAELQTEIRLLADNLASLDGHVEVKASWLAHLAYCHAVLIETAPAGSTPTLEIG